MFIKPIEQAQKALLVNKKNRGTSKGSNIRNGDVENLVMVNFDGLHASFNLDIIFLNLMYLKLSKFGSGFQLLQSNFISRYNDFIQ